jgi:hypothetical protein
MTFLLTFCLCLCMFSVLNYDSRLLAIHVASVCRLCDCVTLIMSLKCFLLKVITHTLCIS